MTIQLINFFQDSYGVHHCHHNDGMSSWWEVSSGVKQLFLQPTHSYHLCCYWIYVRENFTCCLLYIKFKQPGLVYRNSTVFKLDIHTRRKLANHHKTHMYKMQSKRHLTVNVKQTKCKGLKTCAYLFIHTYQLSSHRYRCCRAPSNWKI